MHYLLLFYLFISVFNSILLLYIEFEVTESGLQIGLWKVLVLTLCCVIWTGHRTFHASFLEIGVLCETPNCIYSSQSCKLLDFASTFAQYRL